MGARGQGVSDGLGITRVGFYFLIFAGIVLVAASNTGNNGLYMVLALMLSALLVSQWMAAANVRRLTTSVEPPAEIFANRPAAMVLEVVSRSWFLHRWLLALSLHAETVGHDPARRPVATSFLVMLPRRGRDRLSLELLLPRRGVYRLSHARVSSLFPLGLFQKGRRYPIGREILVYPEVFAPSYQLPEQGGGLGESASPRPGRGQELLGLRDFRRGDDPRAIHWKQTARTGRLIAKEQSTEEKRRLSIYFDNAVGELSTAAAERFEHLVSEAATAAVGHLRRGYEVELVTRGQVIPFAGGGQQRRAILEALARLEPLPRTAAPLGDTAPEGEHLYLALETAAGGEAA